MRIKAFTLAEILITLLIIGVVASLVIPNLINDIQDQQYKVAWKKAYAEISQATARVMMDNGGNLAGMCSDWDNNCIANKFMNYLSFIKYCNNGSTLGTCWFNNDGTSKFLNGNGISTWGDASGFILTNGSFLKLEYASSQCSNTGMGSSNCGYINVDINGFKKPNQVGKDIFYIYIKHNKLQPAGINDGYSCSNEGVGCAAKYLYQ